MKKTIFVLLFVVAAFLLPQTVLAEGLDYVTDDAGLLTDAEAGQLSRRAAELSKRYNCDVYIITVEDMNEYGYYDIEEFSYDIYLDYSLGYGENKDCALFILNKKYRDYDMRAWGSHAKTTFTLYGIDDLLDNHLLPKLKTNDYYEAFSAFLDRAELYFKMEEKGKPFDRSTDPNVIALWLIVKIAVVVLVPLIIAGGICSAWKAQMKTAKKARQADNYIPENGFVLTKREDSYLYRTKSRRRIVTSSSSSGGRASGGGRGGSSGRSGKF